MFTIKLQSITHRPDQLVTIRTAGDGWTQDLPGVYDDDAWLFVLDERRFPAGMEFKFVLDRILWMSGDNLQVDPAADAEFVFTAQEVRFAPNRELVVESSFLQRLVFEPALDEEHVYDVVVVGSGLGGGIVADELSDRGADVLVLEAGSYLFPTHVGNLPREHRVGVFDKHIWTLYERFKVENFQNAAGSAYVGGQAFNLGGRSVFWGGFAPRMSWWELERWPEPVRWWLEGSGYAMAEALLKVTPSPDSPVHSEAKRRLRQVLPDYDHLDAPMAVARPDPGSGLLSSGLFSTADLLTESRLTAGEAGQRGLIINLNHPVVRLRTEGSRVVGVTAHDLISNRRRTFRGRTVVLAAGTVESAKLVHMSELEDPNGLAGVGLTDHPIFFLHFFVDAQSSIYRPDSASKILSQHQKADAGTHPYHVLIEMGADLNQGRYVDEDLWKRHQRERGDRMLCEVVFLLETPLLEGNRLSPVTESSSRPTVTMNPVSVSSELRAELQSVSDRVLEGFGGAPLGPAEVQEAALGAVAHEVGTLRMGADNGGVVDENLKFHAYDNLYACDLSVFPSSPAANPSLTLAALASRLSDHLAR